jgi:hypothetical protein
LPVTMEEAMRRVTGILMHPAFSQMRPDCRITPGPNRTVLVSGPRTHLDGFVRPLERCGLSVARPAPATLSVAFPDPE